MRGRSITWLVVLSAFVVVLCANLPGLIDVLSNKGENVPAYNNMSTNATDSTMQTEASEDLEEKLILDKLFLYLNGQTANVLPAKATKTEAEIKTCVEDFMGRCQELEITQGLTPTELTITPKIVHDENDDSRSFVIWRYYAEQIGPNKNSLGNDEKRVLDVIVDDETGKILSVYFKYYGSYTMDGIYERNKKRVKPLIDLYFAQLGLTKRANAAKAAPEKYYDYLEIDMGVTDVVYTFLDPAWGTMKVLFTAGGADTFWVAIKDTYN